jgi:RNA polymerase sigma factor (sigma-70 family)
MGTVAQSEVDERRVVDAYPALRRFAFVVADSDVDPDDLLHEALTRTLSSRPLEEIDDLVAYVRRTITNVASNDRRSKGRRRRAAARLVSLDRQESIELSSSADLAELMSLESTDRAALYLSVVEGKSQREIGEVLGVSATAAGSRVSRALEKLRLEVGRTEADGEVRNGDA